MQGVSRRARLLGPRRKAFSWASSQGIGVGVGVSISPTSHAYTQRESNRLKFTSRFLQPATSRPPLVPPRHCKKPPGTNEPMARRTRTEQTPTIDKSKYLANAEDGRADQVSSKFSRFLRMHKQISTTTRRILRRERTSF